ncbi:MAG: hypothetical protein ACK4IX_04725 [Candidatus Sericytochromatia bacterium]
MLLLISCNSQPNNFFSNKIINKEVNFRDGSTIEINISNIFKFETKSNDSIFQATLEDIKSFSVFLTTNSNNPFATGSNPFGDGFMISTNTITNNIIRFPNVPIGGPYYAVATAFDDISSSLNKNNISEPNTSLISTDNKWWVSNNTVNVLPSNRLVYSDSSTALNIDLVLRKPVPHSITSGITVINGGGSNGDPINVN